MGHLAQLDDKTLFVMIGGLITLLNHLAARKADKKLDHITITVNSNLAAAVKELAQAREELRVAAARSAVIDLSHSDHGLVVTVKPIAGPSEGSA